MAFPPIDDGDRIAQTGYTSSVARELTVWATAKRHLTHEDKLVPLALFQLGCPFRDWALPSLLATVRSAVMA